MRTQVRGSVGCQRRMSWSVSTLVCRSSYTLRGLVIDHFANIISLMKILQRCLPFPSHLRGVLVEGRGLAYFCVMSVIRRADVIILAFW